MRASQLRRRPGYIVSENKVRKTYGCIFSRLQHLDILPNFPATYHKRISELMSRLRARYEIRNDSRWRWEERPPDEPQLKILRARVGSVKVPRSPKVQVPPSCTFVSFVVNLSPKLINHNGHEARPSPQVCAPFDPRHCPLSFSFDLFSSRNSRSFSAESSNRIHCS